MEMKKVLLIVVVAFLAVRLFNRQPELCSTKVNDKEYQIYIKSNNLYCKEGIFSYKLSEENILDYKIYDGDYDKNDELLVITKSPDSECGKDLAIYDLTYEDRLQINEVFRQDFSDVKPWKIDACNLDNDGETDIFIGVYKDTAFYKDFRKRPFFYSWNGKNLNKKWLGSFFTDWELIDVSFGDYFNRGYDAAAVLERSPSGEYRIGIYNFVGFGFEHMKTIKVDGNDAVKYNIKELTGRNIQSY